MSKRDVVKTEEIKELIRLITMDANQLEPNICRFVESIGKGDIQKYIESNIEKLVAPFEETFDLDEILLLISFYNEIQKLVVFFQSDAIGKFLKYRRRLFDPIYELYREGIRVERA